MYVCCVTAVPYCISGRSDIALESQSVTLTSTDNPEVVNVVFLADGIAGEGNESFILGLTPFPSMIRMMPSGPGVFFRNTLELTIIDIDCKYIGP